MKTSTDMYQTTRYDVSPVTCFIKLLIYLRMLAAKGNTLVVTQVFNISLQWPI
jgi:hypothetical protein